MTTRPWAALLAALALSGCALIAGYDFGKYSEAGAGGGGGHAAASVASSASSTSNASSASSASGGVSSSGSAAGGAGGASSSASTAASASSTTGGMAVSSASASASATSSGAGGGGVTVLVPNLVGPEGVALDSTHVYYTANDPNSPPVGVVGQVDKGGGSSMMLLSATAAPAITWGLTATGVYAATTDSGSNGHIYQLPSTMPDLTLPNLTVVGLAAQSSDVYFTTSDGEVWRSVSGGVPSSLLLGFVSGPIAADVHGIYFATPTQIYRAGVDGTSPKVLCPAPAPVSAMTTDGMAFVYWTDVNGGVYQTANTPGDGGPPGTVATPTGTQAYGIAADATGNVYFARGTAVYRVVFPSFQLTPIMPGLDQPHGIALDPSGNRLYVAEHAKPGATTGEIVSFAVP